MRKGCLRHPQIVCDGKKLLWRYESGNTKPAPTLGRGGWCAITRQCPCIVTAHNHPSGDPTPSPEDVNVVQQINDAGKVLDVEHLDHIIVGRGRFVSMRERGLGNR